MTAAPSRCLQQHHRRHDGGQRRAGTGDKTTRHRSIDLAARFGDLRDQRRHDADRDDQQVRGPRRGTQWTIDFASIAFIPTAKVRSIGGDARLTLDAARVLSCNSTRRATMPSKLTMFDDSRGTADMHRRLLRARTRLAASRPAADREALRASERVLAFAPGRDWQPQRVHRSTSVRIDLRQDHPHPPRRAGAPCRPRLRPRQPHHDLLLSPSMQCSWTAC